MPRIKPVATADAEPRISRVLEKQAEQYGKPLTNQAIYAHAPEIFRAGRGMFAGLNASGLLEPALKNLLNRRVALINKCEF